MLTIHLYNSHQQIMIQIRCPGLITHSYQTPTHINIDHQTPHYTPQHHSTILHTIVYQY